ncbi:hypothetical protein SAMN05216573_12629 [Bradyrhizobium sp. Rc3b]|nr:hypothetical protein SAMN05216573_12629 [Bradyrhizobium sp. Rc3b]
MKAPPQADFVDAADAKATLVDIAAGLRAASLIPYLVVASRIVQIRYADHAKGVDQLLRQQGCAAAAAWGQCVGLGAAYRDLQTPVRLTALMTQAFARSVEPTRLHHHRASLPLPS